MNEHNPFKANKEPPINEKAEEELDALSGHHSEDLYDQNEDAAGEKTNLATGRRFNNSGTEAVDAKLRVTESGKRDALPDLPEENDEAAKWLREYGR